MEKTSSLSEQSQTSPHINLPWFVADPDPNIYLEGSYLVLDFETTNRDHGSPYCGENLLLLACWQLSGNHPSFQSGIHSYGHWGSEFEQSALLDHIRAADFIVAHFTKFELGWLSRCGENLRGILPYCTQIGEYVYAGNRKLPGGLGLEATAARYGLEGKSSLAARLIAAGVCPSEIPRDALYAYCMQDVWLTHKIFLKQRAALARQLLLPVAYARNIVTPAIVDIESAGMCLDAPRVLQTHANYLNGYALLRSEFDSVTGGINPRSGKQMREYMYGKLGFAEATDHRGKPLRTEGDQARTDKKILPLLKATTPEQKEFKYLATEIAKMKVPVQNLEKMRKVLEQGNNIVYADINQTVTGTHRLSSTGRGVGGFQFHGFDRAFKPLFKARKEGYRVVEADAPQLEFRVAGFLGDDAGILKSVLGGEDVHAFTAEVLGVSRQRAKEHTFKPLYGGQSGTAAEQRYYRAFREKYKATYETQQGWVLETLREKQLRTATGLIFYWPDTKMTGSGYVTNTPSIFNYPVQSLATADIIPLTLVLLWHSIKDLDVQIVNTIHDSVIAEVSECDLAIYMDRLVICFTDSIYTMLDRLYGLKFDIPLGVAIKPGPNWGEGEEIKHESKRIFE